VAGDGDDPLSLLQLAFAGLVGANAIDNLPAYLALEPVAASPARIAALLIGVNVGALITPWASLAVLLCIGGSSRSASTCAGRATCCSESWSHR
jgi:arsenical pump membrane protein